MTGFARSGRPRWIVLLVTAVLVVALLAVRNGGGGAGVGLAGLASAGEVVFADPGNGDPASTWGALDCEQAARVAPVPDGGDPHPPAGEEAPADRGYRRITVVDGDDFEGERCELGANDHRDGPTAIYDEGERAVTFLSVRLPGGFPLEVETWQLVMQMKQTQPSANGGGTPVLSLHASDGRWRLLQSASPGPSLDSRELWSTPAQRGVWTRFAIDVTYSQDPGEGAIRVHVDLNADGDAADSGERSPEIGTYTLKQETEGGSASDGIAAGNSIPSHLRVGLYHDPEIGCPPPDGCAVGLDNVQVLSP